MTDSPASNTHATADGVADGTAPRPAARYAIAIGRTLFGLLFLGVGLMGFIHPQQPPPDMAPKAKAFVDALQQSGYMLPLIQGTQVLVGLLLVINRFVPLALAIIAPFMVNSLAFHFCAEPMGRVPSLIITAWLLALAWAYRGAYRPMLAMRARPGG